MATIVKELMVALPLDQAWDAFADFYAVDQRIATGFVTKCEPNEGGRTVTFFNGIVGNEQLVTMDHANHRLSYAIKGGRMSHHNASFQLKAAGNATHIVWTADILPDTVAPAIDGMMSEGCKAMQRKLGSAA
jgi:carbon monoxide dehydrogenase subunit G